MRLFGLIASLGALLSVSGCVTVGPNFQSPDVHLSSTYVGGGSVSDGNIAHTAWWRRYHDPLLTGYIGRGLSQNLSVESAQERIREAQAELRQTGVNAALDGELDTSRQRTGGTGEKSHPVSDTEVSASVVIDLFGGLRRGRESAKASLAAAQADLEETRLEWLASMIEAYANARYYQQASALTRASIKARRDTLTVTRNQFNAGDATNYEVAEAEAVLQTAEADLPQYQALFKSNVYAIANLLNAPAAPILAQMEKPGHQLRTPAVAKAGIPADLLRNRPDVRYDEALLHAAVANIGVADAAMLPSISLNGSITATGGINTWAFGPELTLPLLNQGLLAAERDAKISLARQAELTWRTSVSDAVKDVQVAMSNLEEYRHRAASLRKASASYGKALGLERENYKSGAVTLLDLINVDLDTTSSQISAASAVNDAAQEWATLQIATGAGAAVIGKPAPPTRLTAVADTR